MSEEEVGAFASRMTERRYEPGQVVFKEGDEADALFFVFKGRARVTRLKKNQKTQLAVFVPGDYFGEMELMPRKKRIATVEVIEEETLLFEMTRVDLQVMLKRYPKLRPNFDVSIRSRKLARALAFKWLAPNEVIYFLARKHAIVLVQSLILPVVALSLPLGLLVWGAISGAFIPVLAGAVLLPFILGWAAWNAVDWSNDYYIVTNQRVVWLEKVIGIYDSRQEAPLTTVLSVGVETDAVGRILDYGNVIVRTFVGKLQFNHVNHPYQASHMIEELWERTKSLGSQLEKEAMINAIRGKLGLTALNRVMKDEDNVKIPHPQKPSLIKIALSRFFKLRTEDSGVITYRKHWFVLLKQVWQPTFFIVMILILLFRRIWQIAASPDLTFFTTTAAGRRADTLVLSLPLILLPFVVWWVWQYLDWSNDIFQVTPDTIIDIDRKPLGTEERRAAQIDNILSTEYRRVGLMGYMLNFGTVYITVGGAQLAFEDVLDPAAVQADIDLRRAARLSKKREREIAAERDRMATWLAFYHQNVQDLQQDTPPDDREENG